MVLFHHNVHRANHSADPLTWDDASAQKAYDFISKCEWPFHHDSAGQNMAASSPIANVSAGITDGWYNGEMPNYADNYGLGDPAGDFEGFGHFTQVVWKDTKTVGCATYDCRSKAPGMWLTVCNYLPVGNVATQYGEMVGKPLGAETCSWTD